MSDDIHSCSYYCDRPKCIKAQRDELREKLDVQQEPVVTPIDGAIWREALDDMLSADRMTYSELADHARGAYEKLIALADSSPLYAAPQVQQEPVAFKQSGYRIEWNPRSDAMATLPVGAPLYAAPPAARLTPELVEEAFEAWWRNFNAASTENDESHEAAWMAWQAALRAKLEAL